MALYELQQKYGIRFKKSLGQNLLLDENINRIMTDAAALTPEDDVVEVGAGLGALTGRLLERAGRVFAVEIDRTFFPCLEDRFREAENVVLFRGDILNHSLDKLLEEHLPGATHLKMVSNLPYYITTPILFHFWEAPVFFERMVVMVQEEVAQRMVARVGSADYGRLTLSASYYAELDIVHKVPASCFKPKPKVDSCIVRMRNRAEPLYPDVDRVALMNVIGTAFMHRRKTLRNALTRSTELGVEKDVVLAALEAAGIDGARRPQTLSLDEFASLTRAIASRR